MHQLTVVFFEVGDQVCHIVIDGVFRAIMAICEIRFLGGSDNLLHKSLFGSCHFSKQTHLLSVRNLHVRICVGGCAIQDDERTRVSLVANGGG